MSINKLASRNAVIVLGTTCLILGIGLVGVLAYYTPILGNLNSKIDTLESQVFQLNANVTDLQNQVASENSTINSLTSNITSLHNQLSWFLTPTVSIEYIVSEPTIWVNKTVAVEGKLSGPFLYFTSISWYYELSTNGTAMPQTALGPNCIGVDLGLRGRAYSAENVVVTGIVRKGHIGTLGHEDIVSYYIEAEFVVPK